MTRAAIAAVAILTLTGGLPGVAAWTADAADAVAITLPPDQGSLAPGPGMELAQRACQMCHSTDYITTQPRGGEAQWRGVVTKMIKVYGAPIPEDEVPAIVEYLTHHYGAAR